MDECIHGLPPYSCTICLHGPETSPERPEVVTRPYHASCFGDSIPAIRVMQPLPVERSNAIVDHIARKALMVIAGTWCDNCDEEITPRFGCQCRRDRVFKAERDQIETFVQKNAVALAEGRKLGLKVVMGVQSSAITRSGRKAGRNAIPHQNAMLSQWDAMATREDFNQDVRYFRPSVTEASHLPV